MHFHMGVLILCHSVEHCCHVVDDTMFYVIRPVEGAWNVVL